VRVPVHRARKVRFAVRDLGDIGLDDPDRRIVEVVGDPPGVNQGRGVETRSGSRRRAPEGDVGRRLAGPCPMVRIRVPLTAPFIWRSPLHG